MEKEKYMPIQGMELCQLQFVYSLYRTLKDDESLKPRLQSLGLWWRWRGLLSQLFTLFDKLWHTIDPEKRNRINTIWSQQELRVDMIMIPKTAVTKMGAHCQAESCNICMGSHQDRKDCLFRRAMVEMSLPDLRKLEKQYGKCMGKLFDWRDQ